MLHCGWNGCRQRADGRTLGVYRKTHIPQGPGYNEKFYFRPGNTGFKVWSTRFGKVGVAICWDQWFPESARALALAGADVIVYPSAIGSEPTDPNFNTKDLWQGAMIGHAISNVIPIAASNRVGSEGGKDGLIFYGHSFIVDHYGKKVKELAKEEGVITARFDLDAIERNRAESGLLRDRRPEMYSAIVEK